MKFLFSLICLGLAVELSVEITPAISFLGTAGLSWVWASILVRLGVVALVGLAIYFLFKAFKRTENWGFLRAFLFAIIPGIGLSFITPIYDVDYGMIDSELKLDGYAELPSHSEGTFSPPSEKHIVAFFSTSCDHCQLLAERLGRNQKGGQQIPVHAFFSGTREKAAQFRADFHGDAFIPHFIDSDSVFLAIAGYSFPSIFLLDENGETLHHWEGETLNYTALDYLRK